MKVAVVGSSLAGLSAAHALAARGADVTILDVGEKLDNQRQIAVDELHGLETSQWPPETLRRIQGNPTFGTRDLPKKMHFGSDYIYAENRPFAKIDTLVKGRVPYPTFAKSGFSNIWGGAVLPIDGCDMADWPIQRDELDPYFRKVAQLLPICGAADGLSSAFPSYRDDLGTLDPGPQGDTLLQDLDGTQERLRKNQTLYGRARLAVHTREDERGILPCNGCGHCFMGCVRNSIFSTLPELEKLIQSKKVAYRPGFFVDRIDESGGKLTIRGVDTNLNEKYDLEFDAAFIGAGPINSTRMLLRSRNLYDQPVLLKESQKFAIPILRWRGADTAITHPSISLASVFLETKVASLSNHWMHVQIVPMNEMILETARLPASQHPVLKHLWNPLLRRMMAGWCGMHSDHSSHVVLRLRQGSNGSDTLELNLQVSETARAAARLAAKDLFRKGLMFKSVFCYWMIKFSNPGSGTHCGSSFPMREQPSGLFETDTFGRPFGWSKVHVVDASVLPSIPGTTLGLTVMANAYRIASLAPIKSQ